MDPSITPIRQTPYQEAIKAAAKVLRDCDYTRGTDPRDVDSETTWGVAQAMMETYAQRGDESALSEFINEPGGFTPMMQQLIDEDGLEFYEKARARARMYATAFLPEAIDLLDSAREIERDRQIDHDIKARKETA